MVYALIAAASFALPVYPPKELEKPVAKVEVVVYDKVRATKRTHLFKGPSIKSGFSAAIKPGAALYRMSVLGAWSLVEDDEYNRGWVPSADLKVDRIEIESDNPDE